MATNQKEKINENVMVKEEIAETEVEVKTAIIDIPVDEPKITDETEEVDKETKDDYKDIDAVCEMLSVAKKERNDEKEQKRLNEEKKRKSQEDSALAAQKAKNEKAKQEEETRKINESRCIRKKMKRKATAMLFITCLMSAVFGYVVVGVLIHIIFDPKVWIFVGVMGIFGMVNTLIHTYLYRFIREAIYRK